LRKIEQPREILVDPGVNTASCWKATVTDGIGSADSTIYCVEPTSIKGYRRKLKSERNTKTEKPPKH